MDPVFVILVSYGFVWPQDNSTEVPPSPASVSSSSLDEFGRPGVPSPVSPLQASYIEEQTTAKISTEDSSIKSGKNNLIVVNFILVFVPIFG